jgi:hypothetical protein
MFSYLYFNGIAMKRPSKIVWPYLLDISSVPLTVFICEDFAVLFSFLLIMFSSVFGMSASYNSYIIVPARRAH